MHTYICTYTYIHTMSERLGKIKNAKTITDEIQQTQKLNTHTFTYT